MRIGIVIPSFDRYADPEVFRRLVLQVEALGFDSAWFGDHIVFPADRPDYIGSSWLDAMACASVGLGMTTRLKFGTDVLVAPYRNPIMLAKMAATASLLSGGRFMLGLGIGWLEGEFAALGSPPFANRADVTEEYLRVIRQMFEEQGDLSHAGRWINYDQIAFATSDPGRRQSPQGAAPRGPAWRRLAPAVPRACGLYAGAGRDRAHQAGGRYHPAFHFLDERLGGADPARS